MKVLLLKITTFFVNIGSMLVYNFHKHIKGIKTKKHLKYGKGCYKRFDVHYHKEDFCAESKWQCKPRPIIIYFHGGGWSAYSKGIYTTLCRRFAKMGYVVFNVNYRLAPKTKMEGILADCVSVVNHIKSIAHMYNGDAGNIVLGGDSAGAHISSFIASAVTSERFDVCNVDSIKGIKEAEQFKRAFAEAKIVLKGSIKGLLLFYGVYNLDTMLASHFPNIKTYARASLYGAGTDVNENKVFSPISYIDNNFPACFMASGEIDKLHAGQSLMFKDYLEEKGMKVQNLFFGKEELRAMHAFMIFDGLYTNEKTLEEVQKFLSEVF